MVGLIYSDEYLKHLTIKHPESADRLRSIIAGLKKSPVWQHIKMLNPRKATEAELLAAHSRQHIDHVKETVEKGNHLLDMDTQVSRDSFEVARLAAGGVLEAVDTVFKSDIKQVFCAVRPPGHHATRDEAMGFCLFNNVAVGAAYTCKQYNVERSMIIDWDVHHGNGTQDIFYRDKRIFYVSFHQYPHYPGSGSSDETGEGEGKGFTLNFPQKAGNGEKEYLRCFDRLEKTVHDYKPQIFYISAGFDAHQSDPLSYINLSSQSYKTMSVKIRQWADRYAQGRVVSVLEGGYDLKALAESTEKHIEGLALTSCKRDCS